jgi:hypothetical protein
MHFFRRQKWVSLWADSHKMVIDHRFKMNGIRDGGAYGKADIGPLLDDQIIDLIGQYVVHADGHVRVLLSVVR